MSKVNFVTAWIKAKQDTDKKLEEKRIEDMKKAEYWAEQRRKQNEEQRQLEYKLFNPTPEEMAERKASTERWLKELEERTNKELLEKLGTPEAVAEYREKKNKEFEEFREMKRREREQKKKEREEWERFIGARK